MLKSNNRFVGLNSSSSAKPRKSQMICDVRAGLRDLLDEDEE